MHLVPIYPSARVASLVNLKKLWNRFRACKPSKKAGIMEQIKIERKKLKEINKLYKPKKRIGQYG